MVQTLKQGDIVLVPFPFSDQTGQKVRPALIISNDTFNQTNDDVLLCAITTMIKPSKYSIIIDNSNLDDGMLYETSAIKVENVFKIQKSLIIKPIAAVNKAIVAQVMKIVIELITTTRNEKKKRDE